MFFLDFFKNFVFYEKLLKTAGFFYKFISVHVYEYVYFQEGHPKAARVNDRLNPFKLNHHGDVFFSSFFWVIFSS